MKVPEERSALAVAFLQAKEVRVDRIGQFARTAPRIDRIGRAIEHGTVLEHEVIHAASCPSAHAVASARSSRCSDVR